MAKRLFLLAVPRGARELSKFNSLHEGLGRIPIIALQGVSVAAPKPSSSTNNPAIDLAPATQAWPVMANDAFLGLASEVVRVIEPHTESDPIAILVQYLASFANAVGPGPITGSRAIDISEIGKPAAGETVVVAAASGAVGSIVGQIARIKGARAVGVAGGPDKCRYVTEELGFDACIDHRAPDFAAGLATACPKGIDVYFENVGGAVFETVFPLLNPFARIPVCGLISMYNATSLSPGPILLPHLMRAILTKRLTFRGFIVSDFFGRYGDFMHDVSAWVGEGRIKYREDAVEGLENAPRALIGLLRGENFGKLLVRVTANDTRQQH